MAGRPPTLLQSDPNHMLRCRRLHGALCPLYLLSKWPWPKWPKMTRWKTTWLLCDLDSVNAMLIPRQRTNIQVCVVLVMLFSVQRHFCYVPCAVLYCTVLYCTVLYCTVLYCTVLYCTVLYCTVLYCTVLYCTVLYCTVLCCAVLCCAVLCCAVLCCAVLCCAVLCCAVLCCAVLCCAVLCCAVLCLLCHVLRCGLLCVALMDPKIRGISSAG